MDVVVTTRLHGTVLSLKNEVPVIAIDPEVGGWKIRRQAELIGWPVAFNVDEVTEEALQKALEYCLTEEARLKARECRDRARMMVEDVRQEFIVTLMEGDHLEQAFQSRLSPMRGNVEKSKKIIESSLLASVIIPCYNHARFLGDAIESVLAQTYPRVEIIVVDDGSRDNTADVAALYPNVIYIRQDNQGLAAARNTGMRASQGDILVFLDADDRLTPEALEHGVRQLLDFPESAFVSGRYRYIKEDGSVLREYSQKPADSDPYAAFLRGNYIGMHATVAYRRAVIEAEGGFNPSLPACEDYDLYLRLARKHPVSTHDYMVAEYRQHGENMSRDPRRMLKSALAVLHSNREYARNSENYFEAYRAGITSWREHYSREFFEQIHRKWSDRQIGPILGLVASWFRYAPYQFAGYTFWNIVGRGVRGVHRVLPPSVRRLLVKRQDGSYIPPKGKVRFGDLRRLRPISYEFGFDRGLPIDRYYVESFLARHAADIRGYVLEVGDDSYMCRFGGDRVLNKDILHVAEGNPTATIVADLAHADHIPSNRFDCIILTQTLHLVYNVDAALQTLSRILKPGGVLLATFPGISQISIDEWSDSWYWAFTLHSAHRMFEKVFPADHVEIRSHGNVLAAIAFLQGLAVDELDQEELDHSDPHYQTLLTVRAVKPGKA
jgi:glycosyltransferase involved in cell wall biosynthesis/SAM-dependent methyltransferase